MGAKTGQMHGRDHRQDASDAIPGLITFDTDPQSGGFLKLSTTSIGADSLELVPTDFGMVLESNADDGNIQVSTYGADAGIWLHSLQSTIKLSAGSELSMLAAGDIEIRATGTSNPVALVAEDGDVVFRIWPGKYVKVLEQNSGTVIARIDYAGDIHIKAGQNIVADL